MKEIKITPPEGYEIDKEKSTFEKIVFKEIEKFPKRWEDLGKIKGYCVYNKDNKSVFFSKEQAQASVALAQLSQLREIYRQGWEPNWKNDIDKFIIDKNRNKLMIVPYISYNSFLSFQTIEIAELFLDNFRDLIEEASPLLFD